MGQDCGSSVQALGGCCSAKNFGSCKDFVIVEITANSFNKQAFQKWLGQQINESLRLQDSPNLQIDIAQSKYLCDAFSLSNNGEQERSLRNELFSTQGTTRRSQVFSRQSRFDSMRSKKKLMMPKAVSQIIDDAFKNFHGKTLTKGKLKEFESRVFEDCYTIRPEDAAKRILDLVENVKEDDYIETSPSSMLDYTSMLELTPMRPQRSQRLYYHMN